MILCPACGAPTHVQSGWPGGDGYERRRVCTSCGARALTVEIVVRTWTDNPARALTSEQAAEIRGRYAAGGETYESLGMDYDLSAASVGAIIRKETYK